MKKIILCVLFLLCITGSTVPVSAKEPLHIVVTVFPVFDWTKQILGTNPGNAEVTWLFDNGVDPHSYQPSMEDILKIADCDLFIYIGGESDQWVQEVLKGAVNPEMVQMNLLEILGENAREEETVEGMQAESEAEEAAADLSPEYDEHVWLSLRNAAFFCREITNVLKELDPENALVYETNEEAYQEELETLDQSYTEMIAAASGDTLLFADRFPFRYLTEDYGLQYYAAFAGCSAETEASFETIIFLAQKAEELGLSCILTIDGSDQKIAQTIVESTDSKDQEILTLDSLQSKTEEDVQAGAAYLAAMEENLKVLEQSLDY